jgi:hypothetical protein
MSVLGETARHENTTPTLTATSTTPLSASPGLTRFAGHRAFLSYQQAAICINSTVQYTARPTSSGDAAQAGKTWAVRIADPRTNANITFSIAEALPNEMTE